MKQMSLIEMDGFLKGKCIPSDLKVNETNAEYLVRKFAEAEAKCAALASLEADPVKRVNSDQMRRVCLEANRHLDKYDAMAKEVNKLLGRIAPPAPVVPEEATPENVEMLSGYVSTYKLTDSERDIAAEIWNACRAAMLQGADGNSPVIAKAYDIEAFGVFSATEGKNGLLLQIEQFWFGTENCPQIGKENMVPKFALQAIINRLQAHCNSMGEDTLIDIFASSAAPQQEDK